jgi:hypothetical protein
MRAVMHVVAAVATTPCRNTAASRPRATRCLPDPLRHTHRETPKAIGCSTTANAADDRPAAAASAGNRSSRPVASAPPARRRRQACAWAHLVAACCYLINCQFFGRPQYCTRSHAAFTMVHEDDSSRCTARQGTYSIVGTPPLPFPSCSAYE